MLSIQRAADLSDDDDDFIAQPKKKAVVKKAVKPAVALPPSDDAMEIDPPRKVSFFVSFEVITRLEHRF